MQDQRGKSLVQGLSFFIQSMEKKQDLIKT